MNGDIHALIAEVANGDMVAFGKLYDSLTERVFNYARTITRSKEMAEDITQDIFIQIYKHAKRIAKASNPVAYIMTATRNRSYNLLKRESRFIDVEDNAMDFGSTESPYEQFVFKDAFNALPINQRETVYLHLICGYSHKDVAAIQNAPLVTVKWRYGKALSSLREYFSQDESEGKCNEHI